LVAQQEARVRGGHSGSGWHAVLRRELTLWLLLKAAALALLWGLFFSPAHRVAVTAATTSHRFALKSPGAGPVPPPGAAQAGGKPR
jgi:hypothetical protein